MPPHGSAKLWRIIEDMEPARRHLALETPQLLGYLNGGRTGAPATKAAVRSRIALRDQGRKLRKMAKWASACRIPAYEP